MKKTLIIGLSLLLSLTIIGIVGCADDDDDKDLTTAEQLVGTWLADPLIGDLGDANAAGISLLASGWLSYELTLNSNGSFSVTGANPFDLVLYGGDGDGIVNYSGTYTIDDSKTPKWIDLTCTTSDLLFFFSPVDSLQPLQQGIFELNSGADELTIHYGAPLAFGMPRPTAL